MPADPITAAAAGNLAPATPSLERAAAAGNVSPATPGLSGAAGAGNLAPTNPGAVSAPATGGTTDGIIVSGITTPPAANGEYSLISAPGDPDVYGRTGYRIQVGSYGAFPGTPCWQITSDGGVALVYFRTSTWPASPAGLPWTAVAGTGVAVSTAGPVGGSAPAPPIAAASPGNLSPAAPGAILP